MSAPRHNHLGLPVGAEKVVLTPDERAEVLLVTAGPGRTEVRALPNSTYGPCGQAPQEPTLVDVRASDGLPSIPALALLLRRACR